MKLEIVEVPNSLLKQKSLKVEKINDELKKLIDDMFESMYNNNGIGLAAVQVGKLLRVVVIDVDQNLKKGIKKPLIFINPEIIWKSDKTELMDEGCLSVPEQRAEISRNIEVEVKYQDLDMKEHLLKTSGSLAHCLQHEIDHTNGIIFIDYLSKLKRDFIIKKVIKLKK